MRRSCTQLEPLPDGEKPKSPGETVIAKDLTIDSLAIMDMVMELEDRFDVSIPMSVIAEIHTVDQLADTILKLAARRKARPWVVRPPCRFAGGVSRRPHDRADPFQICMERVLSPTEAIINGKKCLTVGTNNYSA